MIVAIKGWDSKLDLTLLKTKMFNSYVVELYY
jgi:hypothetical protein